MFHRYVDYKKALVQLQSYSKMEKSVENILGGLYHTL